MRISYLAATALALSFTAATPAFAGCGSSVTCGSNAGYSSGYTSGSNYSYGSYGGSAYGTSTANCPAGTSPSSDGTCLVNGNGSTYANSMSSRTTYGTSTTYAPSTSYSTTRSYSAPSSYSTYSAPSNYAGHSSMSTRTVVSGMSDSTADQRYGSGSISASYTDGSNTIVPFSSSASSMSSFRIPGMGSGESLSPTNCPVSVYNPDGAKVLGCYSVSKPAPVRVTLPTYHTVRVVRPIIYVRYPVPTPVPFPVYQSGYGYNNGGGCAGYGTRYGNNWPGRPCGW